jgi:hypothetical protein
MGNLAPAGGPESDYNIAYLHFLRTAIALYEATRELCKRLGDPYHRALCDLDQSEMYLELNLSESYQLFSSTEKRLARTLLLLASYGKEGKPESR